MKISLTYPNGVVSRLFSKINRKAVAGYIWLAVGVAIGAGGYYIGRRTAEHRCEEISDLFVDQYEQLAESRDELYSLMCSDSDAELRSDDMYEKGTVVYYDDGGNKFDIVDECSEPKSTVFEMQCEVDADGGLDPKSIEIACPKGCIDGACVR